MKSTLVRLPDTRFKYRRIYVELAPEIVEWLDGLRETYAAEPDLSTIAPQLGMKVWLLPDWYLAWVHNRHHLRRTALEFASDWVKHPMLILGGETAGIQRLTTGRTWTFGRGLISRTIFGNVERFTVVDNAFSLDDEMANWWQFMFRPQSQTMSLDRSDIRELRRTYSSAVGVPFRMNEGAHPIGAVTLDAPAASALSELQLHSIGSIALDAMPSLRRVFVNRPSYRIPHSFFMSV